MLAFAAPPAAELPEDWHRKAKLGELCRGMDPTHFTACLARLYEHLCDFLYRHRFLCVWHVSRQQALDDSGESDEAFREVLREVLGKFQASMRNVWDRIQQQVSLVLMTLEFQYPLLSEESFLNIVHLTQMLIDEGDAFMASYQPLRSHGAASDGRRQWSASIRNTLKSKAHDYFQSLHFSVWADFKNGHVDQDTWQRLPVPRTHRLIRVERLVAPVSRKQDDSTRVAPNENSLPKPPTMETNPFRNCKLEALWPSASEILPVEEEGEDGTFKATREPDDEIDEHVLLQYWIDDGECPPLEQIGSSVLSNSNRSPVVSTSVVELARLLERYFRMMAAVPELALDIFQSAVQLVELYAHCLLCLFVQDRHLRVLLEDVEATLPAGDGKIYSRHDVFLFQQLTPALRKTIRRIRESSFSLTAPDGVMRRASINGAPLPKLTSPPSLCGLAERCVGAECLCSLLNDLKESRQRLSTLMPRREGQEYLESFFNEQELIATQLRTLIIACASRDILEVPDLGKVSLDHFSNTVQGLRWESKEFPQSPAAPYLDQLRGQIDELARRIPCAGGGSIPYKTQQTIWQWMEVRVMHECLEVLRKCGRRKSQEALYCMAGDFQLLRNAMQQHFRAVTGSEMVSLLPDDHPLLITLSWSYLDRYLEAHASLASLPSDAIVWCKGHKEYPLRLHKALLEYLHSNPKVQKQYIGDLEVYMACYIADEVASNPANQRVTASRVVWPV